MNRPRPAASHPRASKLVRNATMTSKRPVLAETAPSQTRQDEPTFARIGGMAGWCAILVGTVIVLANIYSKETRLVPEWIGWLVLMLGMFGAFVHAAVENDRLLRQCIGGAALVARSFCSWAARRRAFLCISRLFPVLSR